MFELQEMTHATVKLAKADVHSSHPFKDRANHQKLLTYLQQRLAMGKKRRDDLLNRFVEIDKQVSGWMILSEDDKKRRVEKARTGKAGAVEMNLPLQFVHLDDMMTYFAQTFSPNRGMFYHTGKPDEADSASQIVTLMNNHAIYAGYYRETLLTIFNLLKYNQGGFHCSWSTDQGPKLSKDPTGKDVLTYETKWQGNKLESLDMYNLLCDPSVHLTKLHSEGEFAGWAHMKSHYCLAKAASEGKYFNCEEALQMDNGVAECQYYKSPPRQAQFDVDESNSGAGSNYVEWLSGSPEYSKVSGFELVTLYIKLNPMDFGLLPKNSPGEDRSRFEIWRFTILNDKYLVDCTYMNNIHGFLPLFVGLVNDDLMAQSQKSVAEILSPLAEFASFLINTHVKATRKNLFGLVGYDPSAIDLDKIPEGEVSARIPMKAPAWGKDIRNFIWSNNNVLDTKQTLGDLQAVMGLIDQFFPTQSLPSKIASIDRAIDSQVAAVQQGANRRMHKTARLLDDSLFRWIRFCCYYNIIQYQPDNATVNDFYGREVNIDLSKLRQTDLPFIIGQGLKAIDRQMAAQALQQIIFALIQNPQAAARIDLIGLIDYWTSMIDIDIDMKQFHLPTVTNPQTGQTVAVDAGAGNPGEANGAGVPAGAPQGIVPPQNVTQALS